jgi:hypothetical protein
VLGQDCHALVGVGQGDLGQNKYWQLSVSTRDMRGAGPCVCAKAKSHTPPTTCPSGRGAAWPGQ